MQDTLKNAQSCPFIPALHPHPSQSEQPNYFKILAAWSSFFFLVSLYYMSSPTEWAGLILPWIFKMLFLTSWCFVPFNKLPISLGNLLQIDFTSCG